MNTMSCEGDMRSLLMALTVNPAERRRTQNRLAKRKSPQPSPAHATAHARAHATTSSVIIHPIEKKRLETNKSSYSRSQGKECRSSRLSNEPCRVIIHSNISNNDEEVKKRFFFTPNDHSKCAYASLRYHCHETLADPFGSLQTPPHESTQDFGQAAVIFPASEMGVSGEAAPRTLQRNAVTDDLDASSYSAGIPHNLNTVEFIEPWTLDASMTLMTPNSRHEDMSDLSTEDILTLGFARPTQGSPLHIAATHGHINVAKTLILHGSDVNAADKAGLAPIHYATQNNQGPMVTMLAEHGADVDFLDPDGCTPLYRAAESGNKAMVERLLRHGAKLS
ncbi:hypothetical protein CLIM01_04834 [Colletotrichum limetticola]|uniref:Ankyrin repeat protein n=1 Tax=Colletotrichum limetticola TaxID=1209924 RepID=A0ABQ9Q1W3_9PEZI|nr:hypothetical protein CLIM01_04834 [Colletotrichum limetticola]